METVLAAIVRELESGRTIYLSTVYRATKITPKTWRKWQESGVPLLWVDSRGDLRLRSGKSSVVANGCQVTVEG